MSKSQAEIDCESYIEKHECHLQMDCHVEFYKAGARALLAWCEKNASHWNDGPSLPVIHINKIKKEYFGEG